MLIIYSFVAEQSVGDMFLAGVVPGIMLAVAYIGAIWVMGRLTPGFIAGRPGRRLRTDALGRNCRRKPCRSCA